ncbi:MAG: response regulator transcription factor [Coriobacteriales bacterium]|jgi:DNA-binding response OmpR family regulator|nr:response regulator transcription factor [Coriobacteriales bacterium]
MARILIVEDDIDISNMLSALLAKNGHEPHVAYSGSEALLLLKAERFDLILLDLMLPGRGGLEVLSEVRVWGEETPVIMLTAVTDKESVVTLLTAGANDYLTKPFDNAELMARVRVQLRSSASKAKGVVEGMPAGAHPADGSSLGEDGDGGEAKEGTRLIHHRDLVLDTELFDVMIDERFAGLSKTEFNILKLLMGNPRKVFTKDNLYESVWGGRFMGDDNTINVHISKLRAKLAALNPTTDYITTVWGIGFKMS